MKINPIDLISYALSCHPLWYGKITSGINTVWIFKRYLSLFLFCLILLLCTMTSGNLQRWISPFFLEPEYERRLQDLPGELKHRCWILQHVYFISVWQLNDVARNIKSSIGLCALIWIVKDTLAVNRMQQRKMDITHPQIVKLINEYLIRERWQPYGGFSAEISYFLQAKSEETAFVYGRNTCTLSGMYEIISCVYCMYNESNICRHKLLWEYNALHIFIVQMKKKAASDICERS